MLILAKDQPLRELLKAPDPGGHKGNYDHVGILIGAVETEGAAHLCARAALRTGASLVTLLAHGEQTTRGGALSECMFRLLPEQITTASLAKISSLVIGPGLGQQQTLQAIARQFAIQATALRIPMVIDADALFLLTENPAQLAGARIVATPHPGEAANLLGISVKDIEANRLRAMHALCNLDVCKQAHVVWVLKGHSPIVAEKIDRYQICEGHVPALSVGGSGDVLSGIIAALFRQTHEMLDAALLGVTAHLAAGRLLQTKATRGHLASEIADAVPSVLFH